MIFNGVELKDYGIWFRIVGTEQKIKLPVPFQPIALEAEDNVASHCASWLQFESGMWNMLDFTMYPLDIEFGFNDDFDDYAEYKATITPEVDCGSLYMCVEMCYEDEDEND